jgi:ATP phosphoribosyltransferase regulatory subunit
MRPERQIGQAGVELIGTTAAAADAEVILLGADALNAVGVKELVVDLNVPKLAPALLWDNGIGDARSLIAALDRKDMTAVRQSAGDLTPLLEALIHAVGPADTAIAALQALPLEGSAATQRERLREVVALIRAARPDLTLTIDPTDHRGFEYHTGVTFSLLAPAVRGDFGRGGRYVNQAGEPATGFTLYLDTLQRALPAPAAPNRVFVPNGTAPSEAQKLRSEGWVTIQGLEAVKDDAAEARRLGCTRLWRNGHPIELK